MDKKVIRDVNIDIDYEKVLRDIQAEGKAVCKNINFWRIVFLLRWTISIVVGYVLIGFLVRDGMELLAAIGVGIFIGAVLLVGSYIFLSDDGDLPERWSKLTEKQIAEIMQLLSVYYTPMDASSAYGCLQNLYEEYEFNACANFMFAYAYRTFDCLTTYDDNSISVQCSKDGKYDRILEASCVHCGTQPTAVVIKEDEVLLVHEATDILRTVCEDCTGKYYGVAEV